MAFEKLLVVGAGGQGKVVIDAILMGKLPFDIVLSDDDEQKEGQAILGYKVITPTATAAPCVDAFHVAVGHNAARQKITGRLAEQGLSNPSIFHSRACISESALIEMGTFLAAHAIIGPDATVRTGCIINHGAIVDHDCYVDSFSHIAPGTTLGGGVRIGKRVLIGAGANILPGISIGDDCVVGAGAVVLNDLKPGSVHIGVPARELDK